MPEAQGSTLDHAGISDMVTQSIAKPIKALPPLFSPDSKLADSDQCELALCQEEIWDFIQKALMQ